jgi:nucleoid DNA-binding protein
MRSPVTTKSDLCTEVAKAVDVSYEKCLAVAIEMFGSPNVHPGAIAEFLFLENKVMISGIGTLIPTIRKSRSCWNLVKMERVHVPDRVGIRFKPSGFIKKITPKREEKL